MNFASPLISLDGLEQLQYPTPSLTLSPNIPQEEPEPKQDFLALAPLPDDDVLKELVELFFKHFQDVVPCFHKSTLLDDIATRKLQEESPLLLYSICAIAAQRHCDPHIKRLEQDWFQQSKFYYDLTERYPKPGLRTIQAAICIISHSSTTGDFSAGYICLGKAWRQVCALGLNHMDAESEHLSFDPVPEPEGPLKREECRRALWTLFILDRNHAWPTGLPPAIDEKHFMVNLPIADADFQAMTQETSSQIEGAVLTRNFDALVSISPNISGNGAANALHYLCIAYILLGRAVEEIHSLHHSHDSYCYLQQLQRIDDQLIKFRLNLPRPMLHVLEAPENARFHVTWLNCALNAIAMLLHFRTANFASDEEDENTRFLRVVAAAKNIALLVKDVSRMDIDLLLNPHIGGLLYFATSVLLIHWRQTGDPTLRVDIDVLTLVFERLNEQYWFLGLKYKLALEYDLQRNTESIAHLKRRGLRGLLADCSKWKFVKERAEGQINRAIT
ncbi:fungal-specific transcription factor domain-domain-containing protein [Clohesyomyces aquaticus]|uniref:Fungal-specific transcription factor domain-domain-containing protein n=1 Tax=Clohesyomyces aquaticus TaxID=1231657 RepID=A0A1Y2AAA5_9PLEO|nr:fungal-specific transcription factor domain-domain-containing protein [Clohesyomyces aquaticus]